MAGMLFFALLLMFCFAAGLRAAFQLEQKEEEMTFPQARERFYPIVLAIAAALAILFWRGLGEALDEVVLWGFSLGAAAVLFVLAQKYEIVLFCGQGRLLEQLEISRQSGVLAGAAAYARSLARWAAALGFGSSALLCVGEERLAAALMCGLLAGALAAFWRVSRIFRRMAK